MTSMNLNTLGLTSSVVCGSFMIWKGEAMDGIRGVLDNLEKEIGLEKMPKVLDPIIPIAAENFMSAAHTQAMTTVERLRARACALRERAGELDAVADRLEKLCPQVLDAIEGLVKYEQEAHRQC